MAGIFNSKGIVPVADPNDAQGLALLNALQQQQQAGLTRTAGPIGSIAQNLIPLFGALIQAKAMQAAASQSGGSDPETAAKIEHYKALTNAENMLAQTRQGELDYQKKQQAFADQLLSQAGAGGMAQGGMKPTVSLGQKGPSVSFKSDVLSPEALQQRKDIQAAGSATSSANTLAREKDLKVFEQSLPPKMSEQDRSTVASGQALLGLLDDAERVIGTIPKDMTSSQLAGNMAAYQRRTQHPEAANYLNYATGGLINSQNDPAIDEYASWIGQTKSALASFNIKGQRGGVQLLNMISNHFPNEADSKEEALRKAQLLRTDKGVIQRRISAIMDEMKGKSQMLEAPGAVPHPQPGVAWMGRTYVTKDGTKRNVWHNPDTGQSMDLPLGEMPPTPDLGTSESGPGLGW